MREVLRLSLIALAASFALPAAAAACTGAGLITRIQGTPQTVSITRTENGRQRQVARPRILEVICVGDVIRVTGETSVTLSLDGRGAQRVTRAAAFTVPARAGRPTVAGNAYRQISEVILPDMRRQGWEIRLKGEDDPFTFALPRLASGPQTLRAGTRDLIVRLAGGAGPYAAEIVDSGGRVVAQGTDAHFEVVIPRATLTPGAYRLRARSSSQTAEAVLNVVAEAPPLGDFSEIDNPEAQAAAAAVALARAQPAWSFEAEQILHAAPRAELDRDRVYQLIESYGAPEADDEG